MNKITSALVVLIGIALVIWGFTKYADNRNTASSTAATTTRNAGSLRTAETPNYQLRTKETTSTDISTWKTFSVFGGMVSFKYPADWKLSGTSLTSPKGDMKILATYKVGSLPACGTNCTRTTVNGVTYNKTVVTSSSTVQVTYSTTKLGYVVSAIATYPNNEESEANAALVTRILSTVSVK